MRYLPGRRGEVGWISGWAGWAAVGWALRSDLRRASTTLPMRCCGGGGGGWVGGCAGNQMAIRSGDRRWLSRSVNPQPCKSRSAVGSAMKNAECASRCGVGVAILRPAHATARAQRKSSSRDIIRHGMSSYVAGLVRGTAARTCDRTVYEKRCRAEFVGTLPRCATHTACAANRAGASPAIFRRFLRVLPLLRLQ
jgi:hypothetical protein